MKDSYNSMGVSKNYGTPKSSLLRGFSIINHPFWGTPIFGNTPIMLYQFICSIALPCLEMSTSWHSIGNKLCGSGISWNAPGYHCFRTPRHVAH